MDTKSIGALSSFIKIGVIGVICFSIMHLSSCYVLSWLIGHEFSTVVYVTAAAVVTGTLVTFTIAFLVTLNILLTAVTGFFGGGGGQGQSPFSFGTAPPAPRRSTIVTSAQSYDNHGMKLD